jgi:hypothetical protein
VVGVGAYQSSAAAGDFVGDPAAAGHGGHSEVPIELSS